MNSRLGERNVRLRGRDVRIRGAAMGDGADLTTTG
jgi:hypothetical protein